MDEDYTMYTSFSQEVKRGVVRRRLVIEVLELH